VLPAGAGNLVHAADARRLLGPPLPAPQTVVDAPNSKKSDLRRARSALCNLAPTSTGSATAIALIFPGAPQTPLLLLRSSRPVAVGCQLTGGAAAGRALMCSHPAAAALPPSHPITLPPLPPASPPPPSIPPVGVQS
jgi:hypothetical protein